MAFWAIVAELPEVRRAQLPDRRPLYDHAATFGVAGDAERMRNGIAPPPIRRAPSRSRRWARPASPHLQNDHGRADVRRWWSSLENGVVDVWHRLRCRRGHHDFRGGHAMQLGSELIFVERRCTWCDARPS